MKVALVHDWLTGMRGGEKCLDMFLSLYPDADIFALIHVPGTTKQRIDDRVKGTSFLQKFPGVKNYYRYLLPLYPFAAASLDLDGYDLVIPLSHAASKSVKIGSKARHVCYCFTPMRYIWDQRKFYFGNATIMLEPFLELMRRWDVRSAEGVDEFVAISRFVAARIRSFYKRRATVICPPVDSSWISLAEIEPHETPMLKDLESPAFLYAGALVPYKRPELIVDALAKLKLPLWVVGGGPMLETLKRHAPANIRFFGSVSDGFMAQCLKRCRALIFPGIEDFGMIPVECMAAGRPVIALGKGGSKETVIGLDPRNGTSLVDRRATGVFIDPSMYGSADGIIEAVRYFMSIENSFDSGFIKRRAAEFGPERFKAQWRDFAKVVGIAADTLPQGTSRSAVGN